MVVHWAESSEAFSDYKLQCSAFQQFASCHCFCFWKSNVNKLQVGVYNIFPACEAQVTCSLPFIFTPCKVNKTHLFWNGLLQTLLVHQSVRWVKQGVPQFCFLPKDYVDLEECTNGSRSWQIAMMQNPTIVHQQNVCCIKSVLDRQTGWDTHVWHCNPFICSSETCDII